MMIKLSLRSVLPLLLLPLTIAAIKELAEGGGGGGQ